MSLATIWYEEGNLYVKTYVDNKAKVVKIKCDAVDYSRLLIGNRIKGF